MRTDPRAINRARLHRFLVERMEPLELPPLELSFAQPARERAALETAAHFIPRQPVRLFFNKAEADLSRLTESLRADPRVACGRGCSHCCHYNTVVTAAEALHLASYLLAVLPSAARVALLDHVRRQAALVRGLSDRQRWEQKIACPLLTSEGACLGYRHRPIVCRTYSGADPKACATTAPGDEHQGRVDVLSTGQGTVRGLREGLRAAGLDGNPLELTLALEIALTTPGAERRWLAGEAVFEGAWIGERPAGLCTSCRTPNTCATAGCQTPPSDMAPPLDQALRRSERWSLRAALDGEAPDREAARCDFYQAGRVSAGLIAQRPQDLCAQRHAR